jgi:hypothetical protein
VAGDGGTGSRDHDRWEDRFPAAEFPNQYMGGRDGPPKPPVRSSRPGEAGALVGGGATNPPALLEFAQTL